MLVLYKWLVGVLNVILPRLTLLSHNRRNIQKYLYILTIGAISPNIIIVLVVSQRFHIPGLVFPILNCILILNANLIIQCMNEKHSGIPYIGIQCFPQTRWQCVVPPITFRPSFKFVDGGGVSFHFSPPIMFVGGGQT